MQVCYEHFLYLRQRWIENLIGIVNIITSKLQIKLCTFVRSTDKLILKGTQV